MVYRLTGRARPPLRWPLLFCLSAGKMAPVRPVFGATPRRRSRRFVRRLQRGEVGRLVRRVAQLLGPSTPGPQTDRVLRARTPAMEGPTPAMESPRILWVNSGRGSVPQAVQDVRIEQPRSTHRPLSSQFPSALRLRTAHRSASLVAGPQLFSAARRSLTMPGGRSVRRRCD